MEKQIFNLGVRNFKCWTLENKNLICSGEQNEF